MPPNTAAGNEQKDKSQAMESRPNSRASSLAAAQTMAAESNSRNPVSITPPQRHQSPISGKGAAGKPLPPPRASTPQTGTTQLLRKITVAGVIVEVVRQNSTIIYRLPGNMPVSSLTPDQRTKVMNEIQRIRNNGAQQQQKQQKRGAGIAKDSPYSGGKPPAHPHPTTSAGSPGAVQHSRPHPSLPTIAPRKPSYSGSGNVLSGTHSAPVSAAFSTPETPPNGPNLSRQRKQSLQSRTPTPSANSRRAQTNPSSASGTSHKTALERMYQSAYLKLLDGPADVLRTLNPPVELNALLKSANNITVKDSPSPAVLLQILKALTKSQASQLAAMHGRDVLQGSLGNTDTDNIFSAQNSRSQSREASPAGSCASGAEADSTLSLPVSGNVTPTKRRKYNKTGKYSTKKRVPWSMGTSNGSGDDACNTRTLYQPPSRTPPPSLPPGVFAHPDAARTSSMSVFEKQKPPQLVKHEAEVARRFKEALAMDHQMAQSSDWHTPFNGTQDVIQRLLPFHVFQYHDNAIESAIKYEERQIQSSTDDLGQRLSALAQRYGSLLTKEGSDSYYDVDNIQIDKLRLNVARREIELLRDAQLQRDIAFMDTSYS
ncbi:hypothetical protein COEREDRAFT_82007 [Coemansia reversa NRRL 1564]|uniref:GLTSCR protein conserved domain-containing protein n=1 Tax=Coemansia reversa (strain ATCC 12441 / NRRL 1564) TaxID=763665 RepID=A0A2G5B8V9_COERN|nr:hypothetical protein COEREDRAFT_82007 [Coemansia reversa NRRL 1564]|eukprot:PIA15463.1 hypothetical protein COEREDRAFT_82007 [Coemansia reversa NRRL 1564]